MRASIQKLPPPERSSFICRVKTAPSFQFNWHFHPEYELTLILQSQGRRFVGDQISDYSDGDLALLGPNLPHTWQSFPSAPSRTRHKACIVQFSEDFLGEHFFNAVEFRQIRAMLRRSTRGLSFLGPTRDEAAQQIVQLGRLQGVARLSALLEILELLARSRKATMIASPGFAPSLDRANHRRIDRVCKYINTNYQRPVAQPLVAELVGMRPSAFSSFFKKTVGITFVEYVNRLRISHASRLLIDTDRSVLDISQRSGFSNLSNFNRRFLRTTGMTPRQFRSEFRDQEAG